MKATQQVTKKRQKAKAGMQKNDRAKHREAKKAAKTAAVHAEVLERLEARELRPKLKGSIGEGPNHSNFSDRSSVRILGIERKPRKTTSSK